MRDMKFTFALAALWLSALPAAAQTEAAKGCNVQVITRLDMQTMPDGRVTVPVTFEGHAYRFMIDTGGYGNTVSRSVVKGEGYHPEHAGGSLRGMGTTFLNTFITTKDFGLGKLHGANFTFYVDDFDSIYWDGTLAPEILAAYDVDIDFAHEKFSLISPEHCPGRVVYWTDEPPAIVPMRLPDLAHIVIPVTIDGKEMSATLDTGSDTSYVSLRAASRYLDIDEKTPGLKLLGNKTINGLNAPVYSYPFTAMSFGGITVNHPHIEIVSDQVYRQSDLLLGASILRQLHMYIAYKEKNLYLTPALAGRAGN